MSLSLGTVKTYSSRIRAKLNVSDRMALAVAVFRAHGYDSNQDRRSEPRRSGASRFPVRSHYAAVRNSAIRWANALIPNWR